jgi:hypothetical protein
MSPTPARAQEMTRVYTVMACLAIVLFVQFVLLFVAVSSFSHGQEGILLATTAGSGLAFAGAAALIRYIVPTRPTHFSRGGSR